MSNRGTQAPEPKVLPEKIDNTKLVEDFRKEGGKVYHVPPSSRNRGVTFAYKLKGSRIELATAVQHKADCFTKKQGTQIAIDHFEQGKTIVLPLMKADKNRQAISGCLKDIIQYSLTW